MELFGPATVWKLFWLQPLRPPASPPSHVRPEDGADPSRGRQKEPKRNRNEERGTSGRRRVAKKGGAQDQDQDIGIRIEARVLGEPGPGSDRSV